MVVKGFWGPISTFRRYWGRLVGMNGDDVRTWRQDRGMSQAELARRLTVPVNTVYRWEAGRLGIRHPGMLRLALERLAEMTRDDTDSD